MNIQKTCQLHHDINLKVSVCFFCVFFFQFLMDEYDTFKITKTENTEKLKQLVLQPESNYLAYNFSAKYFNRD